MNKILGIVGSPRKKGNTHILVSTILEGAKANGAKTKLLPLKNLKIKQCDGCHVCWKGKPCNKKDDMNDIYPKLVKHDVIIFGTPVYWYGPTALMKGLIDRLVYFNCPENRAKIKGNSAALAVPFEENDPGAAELVISLFEKSLNYLEMNLIDKIIAPGCGFKGEVKKKTDILDQCYELGKRLAHLK